MIFQSTRGNSELVDFSSAILNGIAFDGGLYIPKEYTPISSYTVSKASQLSWKEWSSGALTEIIPDDKLTPQWREICESAFNFPLILKNLDTSTSVLELFHGPTSAFKDFGARFLVACLERTLTSEQIRKSRLLVATSGDTGGAVASAFTSQTQIPVVILYPKGKISARQEKQLTCWKNCQAFAVEGSFDDCQALVKKAFADRDLNSKYNLLSANSINIGRLLPQMLYHAYTASQYYYKTKIKPTLIIPSGNMGHAFGALWAHKLGFPIKK